MSYTKSYSYFRLRFSTPIRRCSIPRSILQKKAVEIKTRCDLVSSYIRFLVFCNDNKTSGRKHRRLPGQPCLFSASRYRKFVIETKKTSINRFRIRNSAPYVFATRLPQHLVRSGIYRVYACSCGEADSLRVSIASSEGERSDVGVYCAEKRPPMLMSGASGSLHLILTSLSPVASSSSTTAQNRFSANFSFVTGRVHRSISGVVREKFRGSKWRESGDGSPPVVSRGKTDNFP